MTNDPASGTPPTSMAFGDPATLMAEAETRRRIRATLDLLIAAAQEQPEAAAGMADQLVDVLMGSMVTIARSVALGAIPTDGAGH